MEDTNNEKLKKLQEQQRIESILKRKDIEHNALVEAAKRSANNSNADVKKEQRKIVNNKIKEQEEKNRKQVEIVENRILDAEVDELLKIYNEQERLAAQKRKLQVELILTVMQEEIKARERLKRLANVDKLVKKQAQKFRARHASKQEKVEKFLHQLKIFEVREKIKRDKEKMMQESRVNSDKPEPERKGNGTEKSNGGYLIEKNDNLYKDRSKRIHIEVRDEPKEKRVINEKKVNYKMMNAIKKYTSVMEFYERNKYIFQRRNVYGQKVEDKDSFRQNLRFDINHEQALSNAEKNKSKATLRPRIIE